MTELKRLIPRFLKESVKATVVQAAERASREAVDPAVAELTRAMADLRARIVDLETSEAQFRAVLTREGTPPPPPRHLQIRVVGAYVPGFVESGFAICDDLNSVLAVAGRQLKDFPRILDWGCGCGRTTRALKILVPSCELHGMDIDAEAIAWLRGNYSRYASYHVAPHRPPTAFQDGFFDFVFGISVFTHLPEDMQFEWLEELRRITRPGGYLLMTTSGQNNYRNLPPELLAKVESDGFLYVDGGYGQSIALPAFYQNAFHTVDYIRREWAKTFRVLDIQAARLQNHIDTILLQRPD